MMRRGTQALLPAGLALLTLGLISPPVWAIPSPDLVVSVFASVAQLLGMAFAGLAAFAARLGLQRPNPGRTGSRKLLNTLLISVAVLAAINLAQWISHERHNSLRLESALWRKPADWNREFDAPPITAQALAELLKEPSAVRVVDVREPEEFEVAHLPTAQHIRYADALLGAASLPAGSTAKTTVFICDSGKRSGEVCEQYRKTGQPCAVLSGGYPSWLASGQDLWLAPSRTSILWPRRFSPLPSFPNDTTYLDTPDVSEWLTERHARLIDVRTPQEFAASHPPGAINLPMRGMASAELALAITQLPKVPYITSCVDNRSCFHAKVLGLKLQRNGHEFVGRYTVPHEYPLATRAASSSLPHRFWRRLSAWNTQLTNQLVQALKTLALFTGSHLPGIVLTVLVVRVPFALRAMRLGARRSSQSGSRQTKPWRDLLANVIQLFLALLSFSAVFAATEHSTEPWLWLPALGQLDPTYVINVLVLLVSAAASSLLLPQKLARHYPKWAWFVRTALTALLVWGSLSLHAAANLHLIGSLILILLQRHWLGLRRWLFRFQRSVMRPVELATSLADHGGKAVRLGQLQGLSLPVPKAWVIPYPVLKHLFEHTQEGDAQWQRHKQRLWRKLLRGLPGSRSQLYAVRSSAEQEDSAHSSMAGLFHTELKVSRDQLLSAVEKVWLSYRRDSESPARGGVIVQHMLQPQGNAPFFSGVLFTRNPIDTATLRIEYVAGLAQALVDGSLKPEYLVIGRLSHKVYEQSQQIDVDWSALIACAQQLEAQAGVPQDIEWAYSPGQFYLLQARAITAQVQSAKPQEQAIESERDRLLALLLRSQTGSRAGIKRHDSTWLEQTDFNADAPQPTPLSLSLLQALRGADGSTARAMQAHGLRYALDQNAINPIQTAFATTFVLAPQAQAAVKPVGMWAAWTLSRRANEIEKNFLENFLPVFTLDMQQRQAIAWRCLSQDSLIKIWQSWTAQLITVHYVQADTINIAAQFYLQAAQRALRQRDLPEQFLALQLQAVMPEFTSDDMGHRAHFDWELSEPRFAEDAKAWAQWQALRATRPAPNKSGSTDLHPTPRPLQALIERASRFAQLKERAKHECLRALQPLRLLALEIDQRFGLGGLVFYLTYQEIAQLPVNVEALRASAALRKVQRLRLLNCQPPTQLNATALETLWNARLNKPATTAWTSAAPKLQRLQGQWICGKQAIQGRARLIRDVQDIAKLQADEIAVTQLALPTWAPIFGRAKALVTAVGGQLSHLALLAREHQTTAVFGVTDATESIVNGDLLLLEVDGTVLAYRTHNSL